MKAGKPQYLVFLFLLLSLCIHAQEIDDVAKKLTNEKIDSLLLTAVNSIEAMEYARAIVILENTRALAKSIDNEKRVGQTSHTLAVVHQELNHLEAALAENSKAIDIQIAINDENGLGQSYITASQLALTAGQYSGANDFLNRAETLFEKINDQEQKAKVHLNKGNVAFIIDNFEEALNQFTQAERIFNKDPDDFSYFLATTALQKAKTLVRLKRYALANETLAKAQNIAQENEYPAILQESYKVESELAVVANDYERAYNRITQYYAQESIGAATENAALLTASSNGEALKNTMVSKLNGEILVEQQRSIQVTKLTTVLGIALITILSLLTLSLYKNNNLRAKANELLQAKNTELIKAKENAEKASIVKAQFLSTITHELRTPMYAVTGLTHLLLSENPTEEQKKHLDSLKFSGEYLLSLINNILDLNKLEANKVEVEETSFNLRKRIEDVLFALEKSAKDKGNSLSLEFDEDIPTELMGDPLMISQILINLVGNAVKFTRDGSVTVRVQQISQSTSDIYLHFEIEDTGEGISKKKQKNIFQNFTQGSVAINRKFGGTGLGLSIVKNLLDLLKSKITLDSTLGKGSTFKFDLKYNLSKSQSEDENPHGIIYDVDYVALENRNILVVEDNKINQMITRKILEKNKMVCDVADNGEIAVQKAKTGDFDLILMDIHMPGISGFEATEQIRKFNTEIPILALTAVTIDENLDDFYLAGFNDIIPKPYKVEEFFQKIHNGLKKAKVLS